MSPTDRAILRQLDALIRQCFAVRRRILDRYRNN